MVAELLKACPFCGGPLTPHCAADLDKSEPCDLVDCLRLACRSYGTADGKRWVKRPRPTHT